MLKGKLRQRIFAKLGIKKESQKVIIKREVKKQRKPIKDVLDRTRLVRKAKSESEWINTGISGFDKLFIRGIPRESSILIAGGPGSGKSIFCLHVLNNAASKGEKALYISLEESEGRLKRHMRDFNFNPEELERKGLLRIRRVDPFDISRNVEALLAKEKGELKMDINEIGELIPRDFNPRWIFIDSLTALAAAFIDEEDNYRIYIEQLFRYFEKLGVNSFLISETEQIPTRYSPSGVEEFLADAVIVLYNIRKGSVRESAIEVLKLRGAPHQKKIVAMEIKDKIGLIVYPEQEIMGGFGYEK